jgi:hypothetical protein
MVHTGATGDTGAVDRRHDRRPAVAPCLAPRGSRPVQVEPAGHPGARRWSPAGVAVTVARGAHVVTGVTLARGRGYAGDVALAADSLPAGVTAAFEPATLAGDVAASTLTLTAGADAALGGPVRVVLRARGPGADDATFALPLTVTAAPAVGLTAAASSLVLPAVGRPPRCRSRSRAPTGLHGRRDARRDRAAGVVAEVAPALARRRSDGATLSVRARPARRRARCGHAAWRPACRAIRSRCRTRHGGIVGQLRHRGTGAVTVVRDAEAAIDAQLTLDRTNFPGAIRLAASGVPEGITLTMPTGPLRGTGATMSLRAARPVAAGDYPVTLTARPTGSRR